MAFSQLVQFAMGLASNPSQGNIATQAQSNTTFLSPLPAAYIDVSAVLLRDNLAVIPGEWDSGGIKTPFYDIQTSDPLFAQALKTIKAADFIAWDPAFFDFIGTEARLERILGFPEGEGHVHEAPVYVPETNELLFSDTSAVGWLWGIDVETYKTRNITTNPPLSNINGGTYDHHTSTIYLTTNGSPTRGIHTLDPLTGATAPILNNFRGRHLNSPNDLVSDSRSNLWFTDPAYGWYTGYPGVQAPELPNAIYFFNTSSKALVALSNGVVLVPNGIALSRDERTLYVSDSNSTSQRPIQSSLASERNIWAFDINANANANINSKRTPGGDLGPSISNARLVHSTETGWPDGLRVTENGFLVIGVLGGADVVDASTGVLVGKINAVGDIIYNVASVPGTGTWFLTGRDYVYKVTVREKSLDFK